jgi:hypothetical protein
MLLKTFDHVAKEPRNDFVAGLFQFVSVAASQSKSPLGFG